METQRNNTKRLHVLILSSWFPSRLNPLFGHFVYEQAKALSQFVRISVLNVFTDPSLRFAKRELLDIQEEHNFHTYQVFKAKWPVFNSLAYVPHAFWAVRKLIADHGRPDILHAHVSNPSGIMALWLSLFFRKPYFITEHSSSFPDLRKPDFVKRFLVLKALKNADGVIAVSSYLAGRIRSFARITQVHVVPNVVDCDKFKPNDEHEPTWSATLRLLFVGMINERHNKGIDTLLKAMALLAKNLSVHLDIVSNISETHFQEYVNLAHSLGVGSCCTFHGLQHPDRIPGFMANCDIFVLPSRMETFGVVLIEAMASGKPVVTTRCGGPSDFVNEDTGRFARIDDPIDLANQINWVALHQDRYSAKNIRQIALSSFGSNAFGNRLVKLYEKALSNSTLRDAS